MAGLFNRPKVSDPVRMPTRDDAASQEAARRERARLMGRQGRDSTNLSGGAAGMTPYRASLLGNAS